MQNKETYVNALVNIIGALNTIEVKGKANLANLSGSIALLEEIVSEIKKETTEEDMPDGVV